MALWIITCPKCDTPNEVPRKEIIVRCGTMSCTCTCTNCGNGFSAEEDYRRWLGLESRPQDEPGMKTA